MNHPRLVRGLQRLGDLLGNRQRLIQWDRPLRDPIGQGRAFHQLQHERPRPLGFLDAVDGGDVGVVEAGEDLRLPRESGEAVRIAGEGVGEDLQRDLAAQLRVGGLPDLAHAAFTEEGGDVVVPEAGAGGQGHGLLVPRIGSFYAEAVHGSSVRRRTAPRRRTYAWLLRSAPSVSTAAASSLRHGAGERVPAVGRQAIRPEAEDGGGDVDGGEDAEDEQRGHAEAYRVGPRQRGGRSTWRFPLAEEGGDVVVPEAGAGSECHDLLGSSTEPFYAEAVTGSTVRQRPESAARCLQPRPSVR